MKTFPNGSLKAVTFSYDDAALADERLVALFNQYGLKATFNVNSGLSRRPERTSLVPASRFGELYRGHELAVHTLTHPNLVDLPLEEARREVAEDKAFLSSAAGYEVVGMAYPYGGFNEEIFRMLREEGIRYSRTTEGTGAFDLPKEPLRWKPTCHHNGITEHVKRFLELETDQPALLYIWGHSYEFDAHNDWDVMERACAALAEHDEIWKATNREVLDAVEGR